MEFFPKTSTKKGIFPKASHKIIFLFLLQTSNCNFDLKILIKELFCFNKNYPRLILDFGRLSYQTCKSRLFLRKMEFFPKTSTKKGIFPKASQKIIFLFLLQTSNCNFDLKIRIIQLFCFNENYTRLISDFGRWSYLTCKSRLFLRKNGIFPKTSTKRRILPKNINKKRNFPKASQKIIFLFLLQTSNCNFDLKIRIIKLFCFNRNYPRLILDFGSWSYLTCKSRLFLRKN